MKVMIDVTPEELSALRTMGKVEFITPDNHQQKYTNVMSVIEKISNQAEAWSDPSISEISYYAPGPEETVPLGKQLIFDPHTAMQVEQPGMYLVFPRRHMITHRFEIGKDHSGLLIMNYEAWKALTMISSAEPQKSEE